MGKRKRYSCCNGSLECGLNKIERNVDSFLRSYNRNKVKGREILMNWILDLEDTNDWHKFKVKQLLEEKYDKAKT